GTEVAILYYNGIANPNTLVQLRARLDAIDIDGLMSAGNLEQYIVERPKSLFPQLLHTERPDKFAAELLSGRIGILVDGLPLGFLLPATLAGFLHTAEDRAQNFLTASALLLLRWLSLLISALLPALFVAVAMYHQEMIPTQLLLSMIDAKQQVPFSVPLEVLIMLVAFELLMEAGVRLPDPVGDTVSIIGALIVGQSAVDARVVSPITVIIVATTAICGFTQPSRDLDAALRALRLGMVFLAIFLGLFGIMLGIAAALWYLCTLESFGVPYVAPFAEGGFRETLNALLRTPLPTDKMREAALRTPDKRRQK
ncbi:MAG: spore germination protein, partial [Oscillospiraceae bacterium]|nr:spore germination protein [Oscillospiraceae bacterium]